jgi:hypothetical protein
LQWLDQDELCQLLAYRETGIADLANEVGLAGQQADDLILAKADLAQAGLHFGGGAKALDAHRNTGLDPAQRANLAPRLRLVSRLK